LTDLLPAGLSGIAATVTQGTYNFSTGLWDVGTVSPGVPQTLGRASWRDSADALADTGTIKQADQFDPNPFNDTASATERPEQADLSVSKTVNNAAPNVGETIGFTVTPSDRGHAAATGVQVFDLLPTGLVGFAATATQGIYNFGTGFWDVGTVSPGVPQ